MSLVLATIVEGHAEVESAPLLFRRIFAQLGVSNVQVARPFRVKRNSVVKAGELERAIRQTIRDRADVSGIIVLIDADDDCPAEIGPRLLERATKTTTLPVSVVLANREFESWFLGAKESLRGVNGIVDTATAPPRPEDIRGAKEYLSRNMTRGHRYVSADNQTAFTEKFDLNLARERCSSFDKCYREIEHLVRSMRLAAL